MKKFKRYICALLTIILICCNMMYAFASTRIFVLNTADGGYIINLNNMDEYDVKEFILSLGISEEEYQEAMNVLETYEDSYSTRSANGFPSNPQEGDTYVSTVSIPIALLSSLGVINGTASLADVVAAIQGVGTVSPIAVVALAGVIISLGAQMAGYNTLVCEIHYVYGITNDGVLGWNVGPIYTRLE